MATKSHHEVCHSFDEDNELDGMDQEEQVSGGTSVVTATPAALLEDQLHKFARRWDAVETPFDYNWRMWRSTGEEEMDGTEARKLDPPKTHCADDEKPLFANVTAARLDASALREAAAAFKASTANTSDGFHVAH